MRKRIALGLLTWALVWESEIGPAMADVLTLTPIADSTVNAFDANAAFPTGDLQAFITGAVGAQARELTVFYAQFQLPDGMTGQDIASINSVNLRITRATSAAKLSLTYYTYGVFDGLDVDSADTYTWSQGIGFDPTHTEVRFPPNPDEISYYSDPGESAYIGFIDTNSSGDAARPFGYVADEHQGATALQNRAEMILQDTDGRITIFVKVRQNFDVTPLQSFASMEDGMRAPPTLIIDFVPGAPSVPGDYDGNGVVNGADLVAWNDLFGQTGSGLAADGDDDQDVDGADFLLWQRNFSGNAAAVAAAPEPATACLCSIALAFVGRGRRRPIAIQ